MPVTVVVVDDDPEYRRIARELLAQESELVLVGEAADGEEALALLRREQPDVLVSDLVLPRLNGIELTRRVREEMPDTRIVLISSYTEDAYQMLASDSGADAFVSKQVIRSSLVAAIRDVHRRRLSGGSWPLPPSAGASWSIAPPP